MQMVVHLFSNILVKLENMVDLILTLVKKKGTFYYQKKKKKKKQQQQQQQLQR